MPSASRAAGFVAETIATNGVTNAWLRRGSAAPVFVFAGHTDVGPSGPLDKWSSDPFKPTIRNGTLYGRGAADMKSSVAAFVVAAEQFVDQNAGHRGSIALLLTSDEEGPATDGTVKVVDALRARGERIDYCVVGEPTCVAALGDTSRTATRIAIGPDWLSQAFRATWPIRNRFVIPCTRCSALGRIGRRALDDGNDSFPPTTFQISNNARRHRRAKCRSWQLRDRFHLRFAPVSTAER